MRRRRITEPTCEASAECRSLIKELRLLGETDIARWYEGEVDSAVTCGTVADGWTRQRDRIRETLDRLRSGRPPQVDIVLGITRTPRS